MGGGSLRGRGEGTWYGRGSSKVLPTHPPPLLAGRARPQHPHLSPTVVVVVAAEHELATVVARFGRLLLRDLRRPARAGRSARAAAAAA